MNDLVAEILRFANFLNHRPNLEELLSRLATDFLVHLKPSALAVASLGPTNKLKVLQAVGEDQHKAEITLHDLASDFYTDNLVKSLIDHNILKHPKNGNSLIAPITNGKVASGVLLCECEKRPTDEEVEQTKALLLLTSSYLYPKVANEIDLNSLSKLDVNPLTPRQRQVLAGFIEGKTNHELAIELGFSISTIRHETMAIFKTLGASDRKEAAKIAQQHGLV